MLYALSSAVFYVFVKFLVLVSKRHLALQEEYLSLHGQSVLCNHYKCLHVYVLYFSQSLIGFSDYYSFLIQ